ncbi:MAG: AMP-binding protein [Actinomycetota bacterium]
MRVEEVFARTARRQPDDLAWIQAEDGAGMSYAEAARAMDAGAVLLARRGVESEDPIAILLPNSGTFLLAVLCVLRAGGSIVPINVRLSSAEVEHMLEDSGAVGVIFEPRLEHLLPESFEGFRVSAGELLQAPDSGTPPPASTGEDALSAVLYTSGTSGRPKGVELTHRAALAAGRMMVAETCMRPRDRILQLMPLTHSAPLHLMAYGSFYAGATQIVGTFNPLENPGMLAEEAARHRATHTFAAPVAYLLGLKADPSKHDLSGMKLWIYGGSPMEAGQVRAVMGAYGASSAARWMGVYGLTEAGPNGTLLEHEEHARKAGSIGRRPTFDCEIRLVGIGGEEIEAGEVGELHLRAGSAMRGYRNLPEATREVLDEEGWLRTGDLARRDDEGYYWVVDRAKDVIISGGVNVYPSEVEAALASHPKVADVAVIGAPHPEWGESVAAVVVPAPAEEPPTLEELRSFAAGRLADFKLPRHIRLVEALPRNPAGKVLKAALRERISHERTTDRR